MNKSIITVAAAALLAAPFTVASAQSTCSTTNATASAGKNIVETAVAAGSFKTLAAALEAGDLVHTLQGEGPFTVFAPTDAAFANLPAGTLANLLEPENKDLLVNILTYHVVSGEVAAKQVVELSSAGTVNGQRVNIVTEEGSVRINGAHVETTDIHCSNGIIHVIDTVLLPEQRNVVEIAASVDTFETLVAAVTAADLAEVLSGEGPFTVFAPTNEAFAKLPEGTLASLLKPENKHKLVDILKQHVVSGRVYADQALKAGEAKTLLGQKLTIKSDDHGARVGAANLLKTDIQSSNGVIHVIDTVLLPE